MAAEHRERELKYHLDKAEDYFLVIENCPFVRGREDSSLKNYYFDTTSYDIASSHGMLRLRFDGNLTIGFKQGQEKPGRPGFFDVVEVESPVDPRLLEAALDSPNLLMDLDCDPIRALKKRQGELSLVYVGALSTFRRYRDLDGFLLECDEVTYTDGLKLYEIEIETTDPESARSALLRKFEQIGVHAAPQGISKFRGLLRKNGIQLD